MKKTSLPWKYITTSPAASSPSGNITPPMTWTETPPYLAYHVIILPPNWHRKGTNLYQACVRDRGRNFDFSTVVETRTRLQAQWESSGIDHQPSTRTGSDNTTYFRIAGLTWHRGPLSLSLLGSPQTTQGAHSPQFLTRLIGVTWAVSM